MSITKMLGVAVAFTFGGAVVGGLIGYVMGVFAPDFYRATVSSQADPMQVGLGFGISQGLLMGFVLACVIFIAQAIRSKGKGASGGD
jgi:hypothetical protein